jgi:hypothetical protein
LRLSSCVVAVFPAAGGACHRRLAEQCWRGFGAAAEECIIVKPLMEVEVTGQEADVPRRGSPSMSWSAAGHVSAPTKRVLRHIFLLAFSQSRSGSPLARPAGRHGGLRGPLHSSSIQTSWRGNRSVYVGVRIVTACAYEGSKPHLWIFIMGSLAEYCMHLVHNSVMTTLDSLSRQSLIAAIANQG